MECKRIRNQLLFVVLLLATAGCDDDKAVKLWNATTLREEVNLRGHTGDVQSLAFAPDGKTLATVSSDEKLKLWDVASRKERATIDGHAKLTFVAFSRDGRKIAAPDRQEEIRQSIRIIRQAVAGR